MMVEFSEDHLEKIIQTHTLVANLDKKLDSSLISCTKCIDDHETRLNGLEAKENQRIGAERNSIKTAGIVAFIISSVISIVGLVITFWRK